MTAPGNPTSPAEQSRPQAYDTLNDLFVESALTIPRHAAAGIMVGERVLDMLGRGDLSVYQLADWPSTFTDTDLNDLAGRINAAHEGAEVPPVEGLREGGIQRGAGLLVANLLGTLYALSQGDNGQRLEELAKPGFDMEMLNVLNERVRDPAFNNMASALYRAARETLETPRARGFTLGYRQSMASTAGQFALSLAIPDLPNEVRGNLIERKYNQLARHGELLTQTIRKYLSSTERPTPPLMVTATTYQEQGPIDQRTTLTLAMVDAFIHNVGTGHPNPEWLPQPPQPQ